MKSVAKRKLNILFVSEYFYPRLAGGEVWSWELCTELTMRGYNVTVITTRITGTQHEEKTHGVRILRPCAAGKGRISRKFNTIKLVKHIAKYLERNRPDLIHVNAYTLNAPVSKLAQKAGIPCITAVHSYFGDDWQEISLLSPLLKHMERSTIRNDKSAIVHVPSEYLRKRIKRETGRNTVVINNWLPERFPVPKGLPRNTYLYVGSLEAVKNPLPCIAAAKQQNSRLIVIGKGTLLAKMQQAAHDAGISCIFIDELSHDETLAYIGGASLVLVPSITESFSLVALEAIAQGTPVSGNPVGVLPELPGVIPFPPKSLPKRLSAKVQAQIRKRYSKGKMIDLVETLYRKAMR
jgi:glycogen synthase